MPSNNPDFKALRGKIGAQVTHGRHDARDQTAPARAAFEARFEREADPAGILPPDERARRAAHLRRAHFLKLAYASAKARRCKAIQRNQK